MAKYKPYNYDPMFMIPITLADQLEPGTLEYTIHELVENNIDLSVFEERYQNDGNGATAINPKILLKVILFAYARGMIGSRRIERLGKFLQEQTPKQVKTRNEIQSNVTDNQSAKMPTSHGVIQG